VLKINLATTDVVRVVGAISDRDIKRAERLVSKHSQVLKEAWGTLHGGK
jgi:hypothetical protein